jgi:2-polyprenyl-6-methoxyphenol hydroxylase-like FAD-dependent oxidoreductase
MTDVVISGGGPNGLMLACELALAGVHPIVLERLPERAVLPKANGLVGRVVQALDYRGLHESFSGNPALPHPVPFFQFGALMLDMSTLDHNGLYILPIPQRRMEELLEKRAHELGVEIRRGHELTDFTQDGDSVTVEVRGPDGLYQLTTKFLVGADGGRSVVRKRAGIGFPGITDDGFTTRTGQVSIAEPVAVPGTGELEVDGFGRLYPGTYTRTEHGVFAFGMFQPGLYRVAVVEWGQSPLGDTEDMPMEEFRAAVKRVLGGDLPMAEPRDGAPSALFRSATGANSRIAERYRDGRVLLVGDSAHVQSGVGGPGLNLGLQDALNLGWKLAAEVRGDAPEGLLDTYESERRPVGERVIMHSRAQTALLSGGPNITALRQVFDELLRDQTAVRRVSDLMSGADTRYDMKSTAHPLTGGWMPDLALHNGSRVGELMRSARPVLLDLADRGDLVAAVGGEADIVSTSCDDRPADAVLIRPDGYVAWATGSANKSDADRSDAVEGLRRAVRTWIRR